MTIRRWTRDLAQLRTRSARLQSRPGGSAAPSQGTLVEAIDLCTNLLQELAGADLEVQRVAAEVRREQQQADHLFDCIPTPCLCADEHGRISRANRAAALLLNVGARQLADRPLLHYTVDRDGFLEVLRRIRSERTPLQCALTIRPRERATIRTAVSVVPRTPDDAIEWLWFLEPERTESALPAARRRPAVAPAAIDSGHPPDQSSWSQP